MESDSTPLTRPDHSSEDRENLDRIVQKGLELTLEEIGKEIGVTRERVRQIEAEALEKLRTPELRMRLKDYLD